MKLLVFPKDSNPYQNLLYSSLKFQKGLHYIYIRRLPYVGALFFPLQILLYKLKGYRLIHIHWPLLKIDLKIPFYEQVSARLFKCCLWSLKKLRFKVVWTVHNVLPHETQTTNDLELMRGLSELVDTKIVHSKYTIEQMKEKGLNTNNCTIIPTGSYDNIYPDNITAKEARRKLHIKPDEFVILFFGLVRPYKGIDDLLKAFEKLKDKNVRLVISGKCTDENLQQQITEATKRLNVDFYNEYSTDSEIAKYFKSADVVCLPFKKVTTSSSVLLAMSFSKPVIVPKIGALLDIPSNAGFLYDPKETNAIEKNLKRAIKNKKELSLLGKNAKLYNKTLSWDKIAQKTYEVYRGLLSEPTKEKS